ncbi:MAG TPA: PrgI family protein [Candidatus Saccharimonadaceae bacterium]|nr:PrgI family protein [Candidatus Saccharimonadaceae bacterium]
MASYKVPQDVEADDKLIGPFSFRQFIYLGIAALGIAVAWGLSRLFVPLAIIPLPIILLFGALALPLRKDQPMEIYLAAIISFFLKPHRRIWQPDGVESLIEVVAPHTVDIQRTKDISTTEAEQRLSYLANIVDSQGWSVRGVSGPSAVQSSMTDDAYNEAMDAPDVFDESSREAQALGARISAADTKRRKDMMAKMRGGAAAFQAPQPTVVIPPVTDPYAALTLQQTVSLDNPGVNYNPYPVMHQSVIQPLSNQPPRPTPQTPATQPTQTTSGKPVSPDIINLASNSDLSIETIAHEAKRIEEKNQPLTEEVVISLH